MKQRIQNITKTFRCSKRLNQAINEIAVSRDKQASDIIRDAIAKYVNVYHTAHLNEEQSK